MTEITSELGPATAPGITSDVTRAVAAQYDEFQTSLEQVGMAREFLNYGFRTPGAQTYEQMQQQLCLEVFKAAGISATDNIVDVGFGTGAQSLLLYESHEFASYTGFNIAAKQVEFAARRAAARNLSAKLKFEHGEAESLPGISNSSIDKLMAIECAFYFDRPRFYRRAAEVLRPGGRAIIADIALSNSMSFLLRSREDFSRIGTTSGNRREWEKYFKTKSVRDINPWTRPGVQRSVFEILRISGFAKITAAQRLEWFKMAFYSQLVAIGQILGLIRYEMIVLERR